MRCLLISGVIVEEEQEVLKEQVAVLPNRWPQPSRCFVSPICYFLFQEELWRQERSVN
jgi:hypothetical protein